MFTTWTTMGEQSYLHVPIPLSRNYWPCPKTQKMPSRTSCLPSAELISEQVFWALWREHCSQYAHFQGEASCLLSQVFTSMPTNGGTQVSRACPRFFTFPSMIILGTSDISPKIPGACLKDALWAIPGWGAGPGVFSRCCKLLWPSVKSRKLN